MRPNRKQKRMGYQSLESRKLLAADFAMSVTPYDMMAMQNEFVEVQEVAIDELNLEQMLGGLAAGQMGSFESSFVFNGLPGDFTSLMETPQSFVDFGSSFEASEMMFAPGEGIFVAEEIFGESAFVQSLNMFEGFEEAGQFVVEFDAFEIDGDFDFEFHEDLFGDFENEFDDVVIEELDPSLFEDGFLDVSDGSDGVFGTLGAENSEATYAFVASENGQANVVLATDLLDGNLSVSLTDSNGNVVEPASSESDSGFSKWSFDIEQGELYSLSVNGEEGVEAEYQLTVSVEAAEPVDSHSDEVGEDATSLEFVGGIAETSSQLETDGDRDVFQFVAPSSGEVVLQAGDLSSLFEDSDLNLKVTVFDAAGDEVVSGSTNASVALEFDVAEGETSYIAIEAAEGQTGAYQFAVIAESNFPSPDDLDDFDFEDVDDVDDIVDVDVDSDSEGDLETEDVEGDNTTEENVDPADGGDVVVVDVDGENGVVVQEGDFEIDWEDVVVVDIDDMEELDGEGEVVREGELSVEAENIVFIEMGDLEEIEVADGENAVANIANELNGLFFDFDAWGQVSTDADSDKATDESTRLTADIPSDDSQFSLVSQVVSGFDNGDSFAQEAFEIVELSELDEMVLDNLFSGNWFENEFNWM